MQTLKKGVRVAAAAVVFFAVIHLYLNAYIMAARFTADPERLHSIVLSLSRSLGPVAIPEDMSIEVSFVKIVASILFLTAGFGLAALREWSRRSLVVLLMLRLIYGVTICVHFKILHPHLGLILFEFILLTYYLTRPEIKALFRK